MRSSVDPVTGPVRLVALPLLAALLPLAGTAIAFRLSVDAGEFGSCMPLIDGCVSISRAARHGLGNILFRAFLLPAATLQAIVWLLLPAWLCGLGARRNRWLALLPWLGVIAAICLILYGTFLGTDGEGYRLMRRYGVNFYFGFTGIAMLIVAGALRPLPSRDDLDRRLVGLLYAVVLALPLLGIVNSMRSLYLRSEAAQSAVGNVSEWWGGMIFTLFFLLLAVLWWRSGYAAELRSDRTGNR